MNLHIEKLTFPKNKRVLVMSDLHGELSLFNAALEKFQFSDKDILIIDGDICEKGENSLGLLRRIIELSQTHDIHCVMGNCDCLAQELDTDSKENNQAIKNYMLFRKNCLFNEMCQELNIQVNQALDISEMKKQLIQHFKKELNFLDSLPTVIESESYIFVHGGITQEPLETQDSVNCMTMPAFMEQDISFDKCVVVGHWPVCNYNKDICNFNIRHDKKKNIIGIDGGNTIKMGSQLNVLILQNDDIKYASVDSWQKIRALNDQQEGHEQLNLCFPYTRVEIIKKNETNAICYMPAFDEERTFQNENLYEYKGNMYCYDCVIHDLEIHKNDILSLLQKTDNGLYVKKDGISGWYYGDYEILENKN